MFMILVLLSLVEVLAVEQGRHALVRRQEIQDASMQQDDAEPESQAAKVSKAWDSLPYSSFAGKKDSKVHPEDPEKPDTPHTEAHGKVAPAMEVSPRGEVTRTEAQHGKVAPGMELSPVGAAEAPKPAVQILQSTPLTVPALENHPAASEVSPPQPTAAKHPEVPVAPVPSGRDSALLPPQRPEELKPHEAISEGPALLQRGPQVSAAGLAAAVAAQQAALSTGQSIQVSPEGNHSERKEDKAMKIRGSSLPGVQAASFMEAAQIPMVSAAQPMVSPMSAVPAATVAEAPTTTAAATTAAATTAAATTVAATTVAATTVAGTTEEEEPETTEEKVAVGAGSDEEEEEEEAEESKKGKEKPSFVEQHLILLSAAGVGMVTLLVIGLVCCCRR